MLELSQAELEALWRKVSDVAQGHAARLADGRATPQLDGERVRELVGRCDFETPLAVEEAVELVTEAMYEHHVHPPHPRYFGLFNPAATQAGAAGDALAGVFNPNVAAWSHSPFAVEVERHLARGLGARMGLGLNLEGIFTAGGAEANHTALLAAMFRRWPEARTDGLRALRAQPTLYVSEESHHSFVKAARASGLGSGAVRRVPTDDKLRMRPDALEQMLHEDLDEGFEPFFVASTAGTTNSGAIDPIVEIAATAAGMGVWHHVDAAWAGAVGLAPEYRRLLQGIERADSVTVDVHKWLSAPMGAGLYLTRHEGTLLHAFEVANEYMPREAAEADSYDLYQRSLHWSRRFYGLKVFLSLLIHGWQGYEAAIREMMAVGGYLRESLRSSGWRLLNDTELPISCFADARRSDGGAAEYLEAVRTAAFRSGDVWISTTRLKKEIPALRACITNWGTQRPDIDRLIGTLEQARAVAAPGGSAGMNLDRFEELLEDAWDAIPERFREHFENVGVFAQDEPTKEQLDKGGVGPGYTLFGLYEGVPIDRRGSGYTMALPDRVTIFRLPILRQARNDQEVWELVYDTLWHELAHHLGMDEKEVRSAEKRRRKLPEGPL